MIKEFLQRNKRNLFDVFRLSSFCFIFLTVFLTFSSLLLDILKQYHMYDSFCYRTGVCLFSVSIGWFSNSQFDRRIFHWIEYSFIRDVRSEI